MHRDLDLQQDHNALVFGTFFSAPVVLDLFQLKINLLQSQQNYGPQPNRSKGDLPAATAGRRSIKR